MGIRRLPSCHTQAHRKIGSLWAPSPDYQPSLLPADPVPLWLLGIVLTPKAARGLSPTDVHTSVNEDENHSSVGSAMRCQRRWIRKPTLLIYYALIDPHRNSISHLLVALILFEIITRYSNKVKNWPFRFMYPGAWFSKYKKKMTPVLNIMEPQFSKQMNTLHVKNPFSIVLLELSVKLVSKLL